MTIKEQLIQLSLIEAAKRGLHGGEELDITNYDMTMVEDYIEMVLDDVLEFNTIKQFTNDLDSLLWPVYIYMYGQGLEVTYYDRIGEEIERINYNFKKMMSGEFAGDMVHKTGYHLTMNAGHMLDIYRMLTDFLKGKNEQLRAEGSSYIKAMFSILNGAFFMGRHYALTMELEDKDYERTYTCPPDEPCDLDKEYSFRFLSI